MKTENAAVLSQPETEFLQNYDLFQHYRKLYEREQSNGVGELHEPLRCIFITLTIVFVIGFLGAAKAASTGASSNASAAIPTFQQFPSAMTQDQVKDADLQKRIAVIGIIAHYRKSPGPNAPNAIVLQGAQGIRIVLWGEVLQQVRMPSEQPDPGQLVSAVGMLSRFRGNFELKVTTPADIRFGPTPAMQTPNSAIMNPVAANTNLSAAQQVPTQQILSDPRRPSPIQQSNAVASQKPTPAPQIESLGSSIAATPIGAVSNTPAGLRIKGMSFGAWPAWGLSYANPPTSASLAQLKSTGANWISIMAHVVRKNPNTFDLMADDSTSSEILSAMIQRARFRGLRVMLKIICPDAKVQNAFGESLHTAEAWDSWFDSYRVAAEHYAKIASANGVEIFCIGTDMHPIFDKRSQMKGVIAAIRKLYGGYITFSPNAGGEEKVMWWDGLDIIGVEAYNFENHPDPFNADRLANDWHPYLTRYFQLSSRYNKPILFVEIGCEARRITRIDWKAQRLRQAAEMEAAFKALSVQPWCLGMFWWGWPADLAKSGAHAVTPLDIPNTPGEEVVRRWYGGQFPAEISAKFSPL